VWPPRKCCCEEIRCEIQSGGQEMAVMANCKNFSNDNSGIFNCQMLGEGNTNLAELSLLKFLTLAYHHGHFLAVTLDLRLLSQQYSWVLHTFYSWTVLD